MREMSDIDLLDYAVSEDTPVVKEAWDRIKKVYLEAQKSHNIDYTAALEKELKECIKSRSGAIFDSDFHLWALRLNSVIKVQQNCV